MNTLFRLLILIVLLEIILGYALYLRDSPRLTGNYISSTLYVIDNFGAQKRKALLAEKEAERLEAERLEKEAERLEKEAERLEKEESEKAEAAAAEAIRVAEEKRRFEEAEEKRRFQEANCEEYIYLNRELAIADVNFFRRPIKLQTSIDNLNTTDLSNKYIIFIAGNSEAYGTDQRMQERLHFRLEEKLQNKFKSDNIIVFNLSDYGFFLNDQLHSVKNFSKIYNPDLVIFYTGGNEMNLYNYFKGMVLNNEISLNLDNEYWYEFFELGFNPAEIMNNKIYQKCLNQKIFLTQFNFNEKDDFINVSRYLNNGFIKIKEYFSNINTNFIFYLHPLNKEKIGQARLKEYQDIEIPDKRFFNLSNENFNLDYVDLFHTKNSNIMANKILEDILLNHEQKIINKINITSK